MSKKLTPQAAQLAEKLAKTKYVMDDRASLKKYYTDLGVRVVIRPSDTEIKYYSGERQLQLFESLGDAIKYIVGQINEIKKDDPSMADYLLERIEEHCDTKDYPEVVALSKEISDIRYKFSLEDRKELSKRCQKELEIIKNAREQGMKYKNLMNEWDEIEGDDENE